MFLCGAKVSEENGLFGRAKLTKRNIGICALISPAQHVNTCMRTSHAHILHIMIKLSHHTAAYAANEFEVLCVVPDPQVSEGSRSWV